MPAVNRRTYQGDWSSWVFYGTNRFWHRAQSEPWHAAELVIQRLFLAGLECPSEACSANIVSGILVLKHGQMATSLSNAELQMEFNAFKARGRAHGRWPIAACAAGALSTTLSRAICSQVMLSVPSVDYARSRHAPEPHGASEPRKKLFSESAGTMTDEEQLQLATMVIKVRGPA